MTTSNNIELFARKCAISGEGFNAGFIVNDIPIKSESDALSHVKSLGYQSLDEAYNDDVSYYTEFECRESMQYMSIECGPLESIDVDVVGEIGMDAYLETLGA